MDANLQISVTKSFSADSNATFSSSLRGSVCGVLVALYVWAPIAVASLKV
jgi:hypothetical protein